MAFPLDNTHKGHLRVLIYPIQFERNPVDGIDRVLKQIAGENPPTFVAAVEGPQATRLTLECSAPGTKPTR